MSHIKSYYIPPNRKFKFLTAGEQWHCENMEKNSRPPRGKVFRDGIKRFNSRKWMETADGAMEFLP